MDLNSWVQRIYEIMKILKNPLFFSIKIKNSLEPNIAHLITKHDIFSKFQGIFHELPIILALFEYTYGWNLMLFSYETWFQLISQTFNTSRASTILMEENLANT